MIFEFDSRDIRNFRSAVAQRRLQRAVRTGGNEALKRMKAEASRGIRARKKIKVKDVNKGIALNYPRQDDYVSEMEWRMNVSAKPTSLGSLPSRQTKKGVAVEVNVGRKQIVPGAFILRLKSGFKGVFTRDKKDTKRYPIRKLSSTSLADRFADPGFTDQVLGRGRVAFEGAFARLMRTKDPLRDAKHG